MVVVAVRRLFTVQGALANWRSLSNLKNAVEFLESAIKELGNDDYFHEVIGFS